MSNIKHNIALSLPKTQARICLLSLSSKGPAHTLATRTKMSRSKSKKVARQKNKKERVQSRRQEAHEQLKMRG